MKIVFVTLIAAALLVMNAASAAATEGLSLFVDGRPAAIRPMPPEYDVAEVIFDSRAVVRVESDRPLDGATVSPLARPFDAKIEGNSLSFEFDSSARRIVTAPGRRPLVVIAKRRGDVVPRGEPIDATKRHGADPTGEKPVDGPLAAALAEAAAAGGGTVLLPAGRYRFTAPVIVGERTELFLAEGATLVADPASDAFPECGRKESLGLPIVRLLRTAPGARDVAIRGLGTIDANGGAMFRRGRLATALLVDSCDGFTLEGVTILDGGFWTVVAARSRRVRISGVSVCNDVENLRENDAFDVCECSDTEVVDCLGISRDDSFSVKTWSADRRQAAADWHGDPKPVERALFERCFAWTRCAAFKVGDGVVEPHRDVRFRDSQAYGCRHAVRVSRTCGTAPVSGIVFESIDVEDWTDRRHPSAWLDMVPDRDGAMKGDVTIRDVTVRARKEIPKAP